MSKDFLGVQSQETWTVRAIDETYHFELQSRDVIHNFSVPVFRLRQDAMPGRTIKGWFKPTKTGSYDIQCAEMCGYGHGIMGAAITVHTKESYTETVAQINNGTYESHYQKRNSLCNVGMETA